MDKKIGIGVVGLGYMGMHHLKILYGMIRDGFSKDIAIANVCDVDDEHVSKVAEKYGLRKSIDPIEVIEDPKVDAVFIASPTKYHKEQAMRAIELGKAIYCEKPLTLTDQDSRELTDKVIASGVPNQVGLVLRHSPSCDFMKRMIDSGELGDLLFVNYRHDASVPVDGLYRGDWKLDKKVSGGGILKEACVHDLDLIRHLFGEYTPKDVDVIDKSGIDTFVSANFALQNGSKVAFNTLWHHNEGRGTSRRIEVFCEKGYILADDFMFDGQVTYKKAGQDPVVMDRKALFDQYVQNHGIDQKIKAYRCSYSSLADHAFLESVRHGKRCEPGFEVACLADEKCEQIYQARRK